MGAARMGNPFSHRTARRVAGGLLVAAVALHVLHAVTGAGGHAVDTAVAEWLYDAIMFAGAFACLARGALVREDRTAWLALGVGLLAWSAGEVYWSLALAGVADPPFPSPADAGYLLYYPCAYVAVALLVRHRRVHRTGLWLDGLIGALAVAAIGCALVLPPDPRRRERLGRRHRDQPRLPAG